jgi:hypothetical protein
MSQNRVELVRSIMPPDGTELVGRFGAPGGASAGGLVADDAKVSFVAPSAESRSAGPDAFREGWADWLEPWESYRVYCDDIVERGDRIVALVRLRGVTKRDHVEVEHEAAGVFRFESDQIVELEFNLNRQDALAD